jgi:hypothetical protein
MSYQRRNNTNQNNSLYGDAANRGYANNAQLLREENDELLGELHGATRELKYLSIAVGQHLKNEEKEVLSGLDGNMANITAMMGRGIKTLDNMLKSPAGGHYMLYMAVFIIALFIFLYFLIKFVG